MGGACGVGGAAFGARLRVLSAVVVVMVVVVLVVVVVIVVVVAVVVVVFVRRGCAFRQRYAASRVGRRRLFAGAVVALLGERSGF